ncbi:Os08g0298500, partial [Oryza sativa Japonica Group]
LAYSILLHLLLNKAWLRDCYYVVGAAALLFILFLPLAVVVKEEHKNVSHLERALQQPPSIAVEHPTKEADGGDATAAAACGGCGIGRMFRLPELGEDYSIMQALVSVEMVVLFVVSVFVIGGTLRAIDNMAQIGQLLGYPARSVNTFVSLISIWNYAGRVGAGYLSEMLLARYRFPRPLVLTAVLHASCVGHHCLPAEPRA